MNVTHSGVNERLTSGDCHPFSQKTTTPLTQRRWQHSMARRSPSLSPPWWRRLNKVISSAIAIGSYDDVKVSAVAARWRLCFASIWCNRGGGGRPAMHFSSASSLADGASSFSTDPMPNGKDRSEETDEDLSVEVSKLSLSPSETVDVSVAPNEKSPKKKKTKFRTPSFLKKSKKRKDEKEKEKAEAWGRLLCERKKPISVWLAKHLDCLRSFNLVEVKYILKNRLVV